MLACSRERLGSPVRAAGRNLRWQWIEVRALYTVLEFGWPSEGNHIQLTAWSRRVTGESWCDHYFLNFILLHFTLFYSFILFYYFILLYFTILFILFYWKMDWRRSYWRLAVRPGRRLWQLARRRMKTATMIAAILVGKYILINLKYRVTYYWGAGDVTIIKT